MTTRNTSPAQLALADALVQVEEGATERTKRICKEALSRVIRRGMDFTSETVIDEIGEDEYANIREPRILGAIISKARIDGRIYAAGFVRGKRVKRHAAPVQLWKVR